MTDISKKLGKRLQEIRKMRDLTQSQLAELVELEVMTISRMESGTHYPKQDNLAKIAQALKVDVRELFDYRHFGTKKDLIEDIDSILKKSTVKDIQFYKKMMCSYLEAKQ